MVKIPPRFVLKIKKSQSLAYLIPMDFHQHSTILQVVFTFTTDNVVIG